MSFFCAPEIPLVPFSPRAFFKRMVPDASTPIRRGASPRGSSTPSLSRFWVPVAIQDLPNVPTIMSFAENASVRAALDLLVAPGKAGRSFAAPPDIPGDRLNILRRAFDESVRDKEFLDTTTKAKLDVDPMKGEEIEGFLRNVYSASPENVALARKLIE